MPIRFYNTLSRSLDVFQPLQGNTVTFYSCGPTVYDKVHLGNLRAFTCFDLVKRYLQYRGYTVRHVMNITDVDDKIIRNAREQKRDFKEFTEFYTKEFLKDIEKLSILPPTVMPKATEEIETMVQLIEILIEKGFAYKTDAGDVYFRIAKDPHYGELARIDISKLKENADGRLEAADEYEKDDVRDFALWKTYNPESDGTVFWDTRIGKGRPGWHIECSAMAERYLGQPMDIHAGGIDLCFPHHTNEIAQSECAHGKVFSRFWLHCEHLVVDGKKMSKSLGNFFRLDELLEKGISARAVRCELLKSHYRTQLDFRFSNLQHGTALLERFDELHAKLAEAKGSGWSACAAVLEQAKTDFIAAMDEDLNVPVSLAVLIELSKEVNRHIDEISGSDAQVIRNAIADFDKVFAFLVPTQTDDALPENILHLLAARKAAKERKDYAAADAARDEIIRLGFELKDTPDGQKCRRKQA